MYITYVVLLRCRILFVNIKIETERNNLESMKTRNDFCRVLGEIISKCSVDENEFSNEMITGTLHKSIQIIIVTIGTCRNFRAIQ